jgi:hypothetical protein
MSQSAAFDQLEREAGLVYADLIARHALAVFRELKAQNGAGGKGAVLISTSGAARVVTVKHYVEKADP